MSCREPTNLARRIQQASSCGSLVDRDKIEAVDLPKQPVGFALPNSHRYELLMTSGRIFRKSGSPFRLRKRLLKEVRRQNSNRSFAILDSLVHVQNEVAAGSEV